MQPPRIRIVALILLIASAARSLVAFRNELFIPGRDLS